ncbi:dynein axonemal heavy chain 1-like [Centruroides vittatus]|uniref:dynein axonemal heavy chain 1-like n=1 Tax=Centruroides vittatus TaxID=120091 RepID=UPI00350FC6E5
MGINCSGRQSLSRLAAYMAGFDFFHFVFSNQTEWKEEVKSIILNAGIKYKNTVFYFSDDEVVSEEFMNNICNLLSSNNILNLMEEKDLNEICFSLRPVLMENKIPFSKSNFYSSFISRISNCLHTIITLRYEEKFQNRLRQFPALIKCCAMDWFLEWPPEALKEIASSIIYDNPDIIENQNLIPNLIEVCSNLHQTCNHFSHKYFRKMLYTVYITPNKYIMFLKTFIHLLNNKRKELNFEISHMKIGLDKLSLSEKKLSETEKALEFKQQQFIEVEKNLEKLNEQITSEQKIVEEMKLKIEKDDDEIKEEQEKTQLLADEIKKNLDLAHLSTDVAFASLKSVDKNDIIELYAITKPPEIMIIIIEIISVMLGIKPQKVEVPSGESCFEYWEASRSLLQDPQKFIDDLSNFDKDDISEKIINKITPYIDDQNFTPTAIAKMSKTCAILCQWILAICEYHNAVKVVASKQEILSKAQQSLASKVSSINIFKANFKEVQDNLIHLQQQFQESTKAKMQLDNEISHTQLKLSRGNKIVEKLRDEKKQWNEKIERYEYKLINLTGNMLISSGYISYLGPFIMEYRKNITNIWMEKLEEHNIPYSKRNFIDLLGDSVMIQKWRIAGLPKDDFYVENAIICYNSPSWPLFIDPQGQANKWIKTIESSSLECIKLTDKEFLHSLDHAIRFGKPCLLENIGEILDHSLDSLLLKQVLKRRDNIIKFGNSVIPFNTNFHLYITTKLSNPHFTAEMSSKVNVINFVLSSSGFQHQLLSYVVASERPDLEHAKIQLTRDNIKMENEFKSINNKILEQLSSSKETFIEDIDLLNALEESTVKSEEIKEKINTILSTEKDIDSTRNQYMPVVLRAKVLFFGILDLERLNPMYHYSLEWFIEMFLSSIANTEYSEYIDQRCVRINNHFTYNLFINVCCSLFEKDKLLYAFLLSLSLCMDEDLIDQKKWEFFLNGGSDPIEMENPSPGWLPENVWTEICTLAKFPKFESLLSDFYENNSHFRKIYYSDHPESEVLPIKWEEELDDFERLLLLRCIRIDCLGLAMKKFVSNKLGENFIKFQVFNLARLYDNSSPIAPLILVLSHNADPTEELHELYKEKHTSKQLYSLSLGQNQGPKAEALFKSAIELGNWIFFQNCHLALNLMSQLQKLIESINPKEVHKDFRLWLTSMPSSQFPINLLQRGLKMTIELPCGLQANMLKIYKKFNDNFFEHCKEKSHVFKPLLLSLCLFHSVILERCKFGSLGFNIKYEFTMNDLFICINQLEILVNDYKQVPFKILTYMIGEINYGGKVSDDLDRRCIETLLQDYCCQDALIANYCFTEKEIIHQLSSESTYEQYMDYIQNLPLIDSPNLFGLHENAGIVVNQSQTYQILSKISTLQAKATSKVDELKEKIVENSAKEILNSLPNLFYEKEVLAMYPFSYEESLNSVLIQEVIRYNQLLSVIHKSLTELTNALQGTILMNETIEDVANSIYHNCVPKSWSSKAYPSLKNLSSWVSDLLLRLKFFQNWIDDGIPKIFWISGFYFPETFLTALLQNFSRKYSVSINSVNFTFKILNLRSSITEYPSNGGYIHGLFLEGARWNGEILTESRPRELYIEMPVIWFIPKAKKDFVATNRYLCPVYKILKRAGTLSTMGQSSNFLLFVEIPTKLPEYHWIKRGVALICALDH